MTYKPRDETVAALVAAREELIAEAQRADPRALDHRPTARQLADRLGVSRARVYKLLAATDIVVGKPAPARADLSRSISPRLRGLERVVAENLRRLYRRELDRPEPRSDAELAAAAGITRRNRQAAAAEFRRWIEGQGRAPSIRMLASLAAAFGVEPEELVRSCT